MTTAGSGDMALSHREVVALYVMMCRNESSLDQYQTTMLDRVASHLYEHCSVAQMEDVEAYYRLLVDQ